MSASIFETTTAEAVKANKRYSDITVFLPADFQLESGEILSRPELRMRMHGDLAKPAIAVSGGISSGKASADVEGETGWWRDIVCPGGAVDHEKFCVISFDFLPNKGETARTISPADQARAFAYGLDVINIERLYAYVGASYGGMIALAFGALFPKQVEKLCVLSSGARTHPAATAIRGVQRRIVAFALEHDAPQEGVALARQLAMIAYRSAEEFADRFESSGAAAAGDPYPVCDYLIARGRAYDMDAGRYVTLSDSVDRHCVDPKSIEAETLLIAATTDRLVPLCDMRNLNDSLGNSSLVEIDSIFGHDAFLKEAPVIGPHIKHFLEERSQ